MSDAASPKDGLTSEQQELLEETAEEDDELGRVVRAILDAEDEL